MRFLQQKFFSYRVNQVTKPFPNLVDEIEKFLQQGHYIISSVEIMHPENQGLLVFFKHKEELENREREKHEKNPNRSVLTSYS